ncbi:hypothetical protein [Microbacterium sp. Marseille-Q6965]|uniref:hypothetical protein n=1 Tax=Microbacterium sp. Marseille-Q6965 TaxID=2965072 RepID=UPI0021B80CD5|nr:hypothetical protein [Microbacterium sp. Marseille-Q6965]
MALADTYGISGADRAPWSTILYAVSAAALVCALALAGVTATRNRRRPTFGRS